MTIELGETLSVGENNTKRDIKPLKEFRKFSVMQPGSVIEGVYQGKFPSKKQAGSFFHVFTATDGEGYAYGDNKLFQEKLDMVKAKAQEHGLTEKDVYTKIIFNGKVTGKAGRAYYSFSNPTIVKIKTTTTTEDIPF